MSENALGQAVEDNLAALLGASWSTALDDGRFQVHAYCARPCWP